MSSLGNSSKDRQQLVDAIVKIFVSDWSKRLSKFENAVQMSFEFSLRTLNAGFCQTVSFMHAKVKRLLPKQNYIWELKNFFELYCIFNISYITGQKGNTETSEFSKCFRK